MGKPQSNTGGFWSALMTTSWHRWWGSQHREIHCCSSYLQTSMDWLGMCKPWVRWPWNGGVQDLKRREWGEKAGLQPWTWREQTGPDSDLHTVLTPYSAPGCWGVCLKDSLGRWSWKEKGSRAYGWFLRIFSSKLKKSLTQHASQAKAAGGLHGWTSWFWLKWNIKRKHTGSGSRARWPGRNIETLSEYAETVRTKQKSTWSQI